MFYDLWRLDIRWTGLCVPKVSSGHVAWTIDWINTLFVEASLIYCILMNISGHQRGNTWLSLLRWYSLFLTPRRILGAYFPMNWCRKKTRQLKYCSAIIEAGEPFPMTSPWTLSCGGTRVFVTRCENWRHQRGRLLLMAVSERSYVPKVSSSVMAWRWWDWCEELKLHFAPHAFRETPWLHDYTKVLSRCDSVFYRDAAALIRWSHCVVLPRRR